MKQFSFKIAVFLFQTKIFAIYKWQTCCVKAAASVVIYFYLQTYLSD